jgi:hypothetical protein
LTGKKPYIKPSVNLVILDRSITLMMVSNGPPRGGGAGGNKGNNEPFESPFRDKPFS